MSPLRAYDADAFARISEELLAEPQVQVTLQRAVDLAVQSINGCDYAGVTMRQGKKVDTPAATDPLVNLLDQYQYELNEGPCLDAVFIDDSYVIEDTSQEDRWPNWAPKAAALGVMSVLSVRLANAKGTLGCLNLYAKATRAYDHEDLLTAHIYARHAANAITANRDIEGRAAAMLSRHSIGIAQGLLMQRYGLTTDQSFQFLGRISQDTNVKLRDVAAKVIAEAENNGGKLA
jgi:GAF domain-containing protein